MLNDLLYRILARNWSGLIVAAVPAILAAIALTLPVTGAARYALLAGGILLAVVAIGLGAAALRHLWLFAAWRKKHPPPGKLVDVGGYKIHYIAAGEGGPTVVWIPGSHSQGLALNHLHERTAQFTRSIIFDRPGSGWSGTGPWPRTVETEARELEAMLRASGEKAPFVIAAHSVGGALAMTFADLFPSLTAGLVLLDPTTPDHVVYAMFVRRKRKVTGLGLQVVLGNAFGKYWSRLRKAPPQERAAYKDLEPVLEAMLGNDANPRSVVAFHSLITSIDRQPLGLPKGHGALNDIPIFLIIPRLIPFEPVEKLKALVPGLPDRIASNFLRIYRDAQYSTARLSSRGEAFLAPEGATHALPYEVPDFVMEHVRTMVMRIRDHYYKPMPPV